MNELIRETGWYLSIAIFSILALVIVGWLIMAVLNLFGRTSGALLRKVFGKR